MPTHRHHTTLGLLLAACTPEPPHAPPSPPDAPEPVLSDAIEPMRVVSYNALCPPCDPAYDPWAVRLDAFADLVSRYDPDLIGLQELFSPSDVDDWLGLLPGFEALVFEPEPDGIAWPDPALLWRASRFELLEHRHFWMSPTPDEPYSSRGGHIPRLGIWARLLERPSGREIIFFSTHFDANSPNQTWSAPLTLHELQAVADTPQILTGDFNSTPTSDAYRLLTGGLTTFPYPDLPAPWADALGQTPWIDAFDLAANPRTVDADGDAVPSDARPGWWTPERRIDHIFVAGPGVFEVTEHLTDVSTYPPNDLPPSDHPWVFAEIAWRVD